MNTSKNAMLAKRLLGALREALEGRGFIYSASEDAEWDAWFRVEDSGIPNVIAAVAPSLGEHRYGGIGLAGIASIRSLNANAVICETPREAWTKYEDDESLRFSHIDSVRFGEFQKPSYPALTELVGKEESIDRAVSWFMNFVTDPVNNWFTARNSMEKLLTLAKTPNPGTENINPRRFRGVVATFVVNHRFADAASLMKWYLERDTFNRADSVQRAAAFDAALSEKFPEYRLARHSIE